MKTIKSFKVAFAITICLSAISACQREKLPTGTATGNIKAKVSASDPSTKGSDANREELIQTIPIEGWDGLVMDVYVSDNLSQPIMERTETKGTVVTTDNISSLYGKFIMEGFLDNYDQIDCDEEDRPVLTDEDQYIVDGQVNYQSGEWSLTNGSGDPYPWLNDIQYSFWSFAPETHYGTFSFGTTGDRDCMTVSSYVNPNYAPSQEDLIIAYNNRWYGSRDDSETVDVNFRHALASISFDTSAITDYEVAQIILIGPYMAGSCEVIGSKLSSTDVSEAFVWNAFMARDDVAIMSGSEDTFFMIPQTVPDGSTITIALQKDGETTQVTQAFSTEWKAGKYYRYVLKYVNGDVDVEVVEGFNGTVKENLGAKNTGNATEFIRALVVANWVDDAGRIVSSVDFSTNGTITGYLEDGCSWKKHTDGYYYYTKAIEAGCTTEGKIFTSYTPPASPAKVLQLEMTVVVQCVEYDSSCAKAKSAWGDDIPLSGTIE